MEMRPLAGNEAVSLQGDYLQVLKGTIVCEYYFLRFFQREGEMQN